MQFLKWTINSRPVFHYISDYRKIFIDFEQAYDSASIKKDCGKLCNVLECKLIRLSKPYLKTNNSVKVDGESGQTFLINRSLNQEDALSLINQTKHQNSIS